MRTTRMMGAAVLALVAAGCSADSPVGLREATEDNQYSRIAGDFGNVTDLRVQVCKTWEDAVNAPPQTSFSFSYQAAEAGVSGTQSTNLEKCAVLGDGTANGPYNWSATEQLTVTELPVVGVEILNIYLLSRTERDATGFPVITYVTDLNGGTVSFSAKDYAWVVFGNGGAPPPPPPPPPPPGGGEGCTPGYWRQSQHFGNWVGYAPSDDYATTFGVNSSFTLTLLQVVSQGGGGEYALGRHAVAALLNVAAGGVDYAYSTADVIAMVQGAYASGDFESAKNLLEGENEMGCPLGNAP